ncbi:YgjV family protein [Orbus mooreae]|uniref:YgjV family protein n=1 Tax=Orbus mooreae TaxID=3074107 RepID=UPI00370D4322
MNDLLNSTWLAQFFTIPQLIGVLGYIVGVSAFLQRSDNAFRWQLTIVNIIMSVHFYLLGPDSYPAAILNIINIFRNIASAYTRNLFVMIFFILLMWVLSLPTIVVPMQYLSVIGTSLVTFSMFRLQQASMRFGILLSSVLWIIYSIWMGSIGSLAIETTFAIINIITIIKLSKITKQTNTIS